MKRDGTRSPQSIELADYSEMLRNDHDLRGAQIDIIIQYSVDNDLISVWRDGQSGEMWVTALVDEDEEDEEEGAVEQGQIPDGYR